METTREAVRQPGRGLSHAERDACLHALGELHAAGKLSFAELDARIEAALAAQTEEELAALVGDRPRTDALEAHTREDTQAADAPAAAPPARRAGPLLVALTLVGFVGLVLTALLRALTVAAIALGTVLVRALLLTASGACALYRAVAQRSRAGAAVVHRHQVPSVRVRQQGRRFAADRAVALPPAPSQELALIPRPQVPAQREPAKVHPVLVRRDPDPASAALVLAARSTDVAVIRGEVRTRDLATSSDTRPRQDHRVRALVSQLRPLVHRLTDRARWRRSTRPPCERPAHALGWHRTSRVS